MGFFLSKMEEYLENHLQLLRTRRQALSRPLPPRKPTPSTPWCEDDPFEVESRGFYTSAPATSGTSPGDKTQRPSSKKKRKGKVGDSLVERGNGVRKPDKSRSNPIWTPALDKLLRKYLRKLGWGAWARIEKTNKFPAEFTAKVVSRRAKALGYSRDNLPKVARKLSPR